MLFSRKSFSKTCAISSGKNTRTFSPGPPEVNSKPQSTDTLRPAEKVLNRQNSPKIQEEYFSPDSSVRGYHGHGTQLRSSAADQEVTGTKEMKYCIRCRRRAEYSVWRSAGSLRVLRASLQHQQQERRLPSGVPLGALAAFCCTDGVVSRATLA